MSRIISISIVGMGLLLASCDIFADKSAIYDIDSENVVWQLEYFVDQRGRPSDVGRDDFHLVFLRDVLSMGPVLIGIEYSERQDQYVGNRFTGMYTRGRQSTIDVFDLGSTLLRIFPGSRYTDFMTGVGGATSYRLCEHRLMLYSKNGTLIFEGIQNEWRFKSFMLSAGLGYECSQQGCSFGDE